ncbi:MAG TPA: hypothetical protein VMF90_24640 [Rhizobiaceae bacterium]|nr:hypothetical protein [Rhizobiaceae bacterium]
MSSFEPGEIYAYNYLWLRQHRTGEESGRKVRPCALIFRSTWNPPRLYLFAITTQQPDESREAIEIPAKERSLGGLDSRCWLVIDELNITLQTRLYDFQSTDPLGRFSETFTRMLAARISAAVRAGMTMAIKRN